MSMYTQFQTDEALERQGVVIDYGDFRVTIARAGGSNKRFTRVLEERSKPYRRAIQTETLANDMAIKMLHQVYAEAIIIKWETQVDGEWKVGIEAPEEGAPLLKPTKENIVATFEALPDLFLDLQSQATKVALFRQELREGDAKN